jgi:TPR repeat protein
MFWLCASAQAQTIGESLSALERKDYSAAFTGFSALAEKGNITAQGVLATMYERGWGTSKMM